jgi:hypothetical protein
VRYLGAAIAVVVAVVVTVVAAFSGPGPAAGKLSGGAAAGKLVRSHSLVGTFTLFGPKAQQNPCALRHPDVAEGVPVLVKGEGGSAMGSASLSSGSADATRRACIYHFTVRSLPDAQTYTVEVGKLGGLRYSLADLTKTGWNVGLNLGIPDGLH